ncbi:hypothetical protein [Cupriavidus plantarum]|uniref:hypothetical protein n=1 Tax=Cupriavidus plantarum TaxID=942865 RepID=UPI0011C03D33|nr:hypothetical protein [Cupriavidus plantarum]
MTLRRFHVAWLLSMSGVAVPVSVGAQAHAQEQEQEQRHAVTPPSARSPVGPPPGQIVRWSLSQPHCGGTLIAPRVMLTAGSCAPRVSHRRSAFVLTDAGAVRARFVRYPRRIGPVGDVAIMLLERPLPGAAIREMAPVPSYRQEQSALVDGADDMTEGARLVAYGSAPESRSTQTGSRKARRMDAYQLRHPAPGSGTIAAGAAAARPLVYRSVAGYRRAEPQRIDGRSPHQLFNALVMRAFYPHRRRQASDARALLHGDRDLDEQVLLTSGLATDARMGIASPLRQQDRGGGVFVLDAEQREWLVGTVLGTQMQARQSEYWPWVFAMLQRYGMQAEALQLARQVLGTGRWGEKGRQGTVGDIYAYVNPHTNRVEFARLAALDRQGQYGYLPIGGRDNANWEHLGHDLPTAAEATARIRAWLPDTSDGKAGEVFVRAHPTARTFEYFRLRTDVPGTLSEPPVDATTNAEWEYLGGNLVV